MKLSKTIASVLTASLCMSMFLCGCNSTTETTKKPKDPDETKPVQTEPELPENELLFISGYDNAAWGHQSSRTFVLSDGRVYSSEESFESYGTNWSDRLSDNDRLKILMDYTEPVLTLEMDDIRQIYKYMVKIDPDAKFVYDDEYACDAGTSYIQVLVDGEWIEISESGDRNGELNDRNAKRVKKYIRDAFSNAEWGATPHVYSNSESFIGTFKCPKTTVKPCRQIITNIDELKKFEKDTGLDIRNMEAFEYFGDSEYDRFDYICIAVEIVEYPASLKLDEVTADAFVVSGGYCGFAFLDKPGLTDSNDKTYAYCHIVQLPAYQVSDYDMFLG